MKAVGLGKTAEQQRQEKAMGMLIERLNQQIGKTTANSRRRDRSVRR
jgi:hypothetical protein